MFKRTLNKAVIALVLVVISVGLASLGIQVPVSQGLSAPSKPKPRPRAVLKNQASTCKGQLNNAFQPDLAFSVTHIRLTQAAPFTTLALQAPLSFYSLRLISSSSPRSPPFLS